jgi:RimJ/RimL family protein N-acetyltransferase
MSARDERSAGPSVDETPAQSPERRTRAWIRPAEPGDAAAMVALLNAVGAEPEGWLLSDPSRRSVASERRYIRSVRRHPDAALLVAELDGEIVGRLSTARDPHPSSAHVADFGLTVAAAHRRRGVGTALLAGADAWARTAGIRKLELHVFPHNEAAIALYEKVGYVREGYRANHYRLPDGRFVDVILMAKQL